MDSEADSIFEHFPILYYVLSQLDPIPGKSSYQLPSETKESVLAKLSHLNNPKVLASIVQAIPDNLTHTLSALISLGPRPDPSAVAAARDRIIEIQFTLQKNLQEIEDEADSDGFEVEDRVEREKQLRRAAEKETEIYKAVARVKEMHESYEKQLIAVQDRVVEVYESAVAELDKETDLEVNEEVIRILKEAESGVVEKVDLFGQQIRFLPEEFGKLRRLIDLNLSHNQLEVIFIFYLYFFKWIFWMDERELNLTKSEFLSLHLTFRSYKWIATTPRQHYDDRRTNRKRKNGEWSILMEGKKLEKSERGKQKLTMI